MSYTRRQLGGVSSQPPGREVARRSLGDLVDSVADMPTIWKVGMVIAAGMAVKTGWEALSEKRRDRRHHREVDRILRALRARKR